MMTKVGRSVSIKSELWTWLNETRGHGNVSCFINDMLQEEYNKTMQNPTLPLMSQEVEKLNEIIKNMEKKRDSIIEQMMSLTRFHNKKSQEEQIMKEKLLKEQLEAEKHRIKEIKKFMKKLKGISDVIREFKEDPDRDAQWYVQKQIELHDKNGIEVPFKKLKLFLERCC